MRAIGGGGGETHFTVNVVSAEFEGKVRSPLSLPRLQVNGPVHS